MSTDLRYIEHLARSNYEAIGFIPRPRLEEYAARGQILIAEENDEAAGFLVFGAGWPTLRVYQACVQYDARRREHGALLVDRLISEAQRRGCHLISLWCADDLPANEFWQALGFRCIGDATWWHEAWAAAQQVGSVRANRSARAFRRSRMTPSTSANPHQMRSEK